jgi:hypothetical protein
MSTHISRLEQLERRVEVANKRSLLGPFVPGDGEGSTIETHGMSMNVSPSGNWTAFMHCTGGPLHGNPHGTRSLSGWGRTKEEAAKDAFALLWNPQSRESLVMPPNAAQESDHDRSARIMGEALLATGLVLMPVELMRRAITVLRGHDELMGDKLRDALMCSGGAMADELQQYLPLEKS